MQKEEYKKELERFHKDPCNYERLEELVDYENKIYKEENKKLIHREQLWTLPKQEKKLLSL